MQQIMLPYREEALSYFNMLSDYRWAVFLDSGDSREGLQRYSIITAEPLMELMHEQEFCVVKQGAKQRFQGEVWQCLDFLLQQLPQNTGFPFCGGVIGYLSYDLGSDDFKPSEKGERMMPLAVAGLYQWCLLIDHQEQRSLLLSWDDGYNLDYWKAKLQTVSVDQIIKKGGACSTKSNMSFSYYKKAFRQIKQYLFNGDCYQVNFAQRFETDLGNEITARELYQCLRDINKVPFGGWLHYPFADVLSFSPECFITLDGQKVATYPIKGTCARENERVRDKENRDALEQSDKNRAENLMIVDLMRNDLGRVCIKGSIQVPELFEVKSFQYVHHLQSKITGVLAKGFNAVSLLKACFPGGSITGAPKKRAMEVIDELEKNHREIYCGSIFYMTKDKMVSNIAIRTAVYKAGKLYYWAGGGIVDDSQVDDEYQETLDKARVFSSLQDLQDIN